ncbi:MAG: PASTA domain-containing protein [Turicibacter sp.]|nr:PASTA domain-containing protein [Turicibacter sp.]
MKKIKKRKKRLRLQPRFFIIIFMGLIIGGIIYQADIRNQSRVMPNLHGWLASEVQEYLGERPNVSVIFEYEHSDIVEPTRVISQSLKPGRVIGDEAVVVSVTISLGSEVAP